MPDTASARPGRGRRPAAEVRAGVLAAAARLLLDEGLPAVTFERVAAAAGSSKVTLYKWWPSRGALAAEAFFLVSQPELDFPDTGEVRTDLIDQLIAFVGLMNAGGAARPIRELIGAAQTDRALREAWDCNYVRPRRALAEERLRSAQRSGQVRADADLDIVVDQLWGVCYYRMLISDDPVDEALVRRLVDQALYGAATA